MSPTDIAQLVASLNGTDFTRQGRGEKLGNLPSVVFAGAFDSGGTFRSGQIGFGARPVSDIDIPSGQQFGLTMDHTRRLDVNATAWPDWTPTGRTIFEDRMANTISWVQAGGTVAYSTVRPYPGMVNCMRMTTGAGAGNQANASLRLFRLADAIGRGLGGSNPGNGPKIWYGVLFKNTDANLGLFELGMQLTDGAQTMIGRVRVEFPTGLIRVLDSAGATTAINAGSQAGLWSSGGSPVALSTSEGWHWFGMELHYQSGAQTLRYVRIRIDDTAYDATPYSPAFNSAVAAVSDTLLEINVQNNAAVVEICDVGYIQVMDLTNVRGLLG